MEIVTRQQPITPSRLTSISSIRSPSLASRPGPTLPTHRFPIGAEVFLIDPVTGNNSLANGNTIGTGFDGLNSHRIALSAQPPSWAKIFFDGGGNSLTPYHYYSSGVFVVLRRLIKLPRGQSLVSDGVNFHANTGDLASGEYIYHITPKCGVGKEKLVSVTSLVEVRFSPGDWVWYSPLKVPVGGDSNGAGGVARQRREKAMVIGVEVLRGKRVCHVHLVDQFQDRIMVPEERLEKTLRGPV